MGQKYHDKSKKEKEKQKVKRFIKRLGRKQGGFTLIELLVVIAILGILAAIIVPSVSKYINSGQVAAKDTEKHLVQNAIDAAMADAKIATLPGLNGTALATPFTKDADFVVYDATSSGGKKYTVGDYFGNDLTSLAYSYTFGPDGKATQSATPYVAPAP